MTIINELGVDSPLVSKDIFQSPNHTNVEVFGIRFDPLSASTLVAGTRVLNDGSSVGSGQTATYIGTVSSDHAPGTHWYHSNVRGSSALHVMGGLFGAIVVDPAPSYIPSLLSIISLRQTQIVFSHIMLEEDPDAEMGKMLSEVELLATPWSVTQLSTAAGSALYINPTYNTSTNVTIRDAWFTNGQYQPAVEAASGESQVFDIVAASGDRILELEIRSSILSNAPTNQCSMVLLALDGVYLTSSRVVTHLPLLQGSRAAIVVRCLTAGQYYLMSVSEADPRSPYYPIGTLESKSVQVLISLKIKGAAATASGPTFYLGSIPRPSYLQNFMNIDPMITTKQIWSISTAQAGCCGALSSPISLNCNPLFRLGIGSDCTLPCLSHTACSLLYGTSYTDTSFPSVLNGMCEYNNNSTRNVVTINQNNRTFADSSDVVQEISLWGLSSYPIPINLHGTHFQIIGYDNTNLDTHYNGANELDTAPDLSLLYGQVGDYRDTWPAIAGKSILRARVIRQDAVTRISMSTTFLKYADRGMKADVALTFAPPSKAPVINPGTNSSTGNSNSTVPNGPGPPVQNTSNPVPIVDAFSLALDGSIAAAAADQSAAQMEYLRLKNIALPSNLFPLKGHQTVVKFVGNQSLAIITEQLPGLSPDIELLPASEEDFFISSLVLDQDSNRCVRVLQYFKTQLADYSHLR